MILHPSLVIRLATPGDAPALEHLARLDGQRLPSGQVLVAEVEGRLRAALELDGGRAMADPFAPTADIVALLRMRAGRLTGDAARAPSLRERLAGLRRRGGHTAPAGT